MSLHVLANHMAAHGRGPDSMLVHMSPQEVQALQELAMKNGGSLTINPQTGLPEAGFLDSILPIVAGIALGPAGFGLMSAGMAGLTVGGVTALATGSLEKGLMAGMGAYGGAGLAEGLAGSAAGSTAAELATKSAVEDQSVAEASRLAGKEIAAQAPLQQIGTGVQGLGTEAGRASALNAMGGGMGALKYGAAAIAPIMADQMVQTTTQAPSTNTGYIRQKVYDPISGTYTDVGPVKASDWGSRSFSDLRRGYADGGIVALAQGDLISDTATAPAAPAARSYTDQQIQDAIAASRQQGFNNDQILQGAKANYGVDVSRFLNPVTSAPVVTPAPTGGLDTLAANQAAKTLAQNTNSAGSGLLSELPQTIKDFAAANPNALSGATTATTGGLDTLAANQAATGATGDTLGAVTSGANNATSVTSGDSGVLTLLANQGAASVIGNTTAAAAAPAVDQQALAIQAAQAGVNAGKTPAQIAAEVDAQYGIKLNAQNVTDFIAANGIVPQAGSDKYVANVAAAAAANPNATYDQIYAAMVAQGLKPADVAAAMEKAGLSRAAAYAATSKDFKGVAGGTGLAGLNANIKAAMDNAATASPDTTAAEIKALLATYGADSTDFKRATGMTPEEWDAKHSSATSIIGGNGTDTVINSSITGGAGNDSIVGGGGNDTVTKPVGVVTNTGAVLPVVTIPGTNVTRVVNPTQIATTAVETPTALNEAARTALPVGVSGNQTATINPNGTVSMNTGTPNMPAGGYTGMESLRDAYTKGGGSLGYTPYTPKTMAEFNAKYTNTGDTKSAYDYLMGKGAYPTKSNVGQIMRPYGEATLGMPVAGNKPYIWDQASGRYMKNLDYVRPMRDSAGNVTYGMSQKELTTFLANQAKNPTMSGQELYDWAVKNNVSAQDIADARGVPLSEVYAQFRNFKQAADATKEADAAVNTTATGKTSGRAAGGSVGYAVGGGLGSLGSYSDGGRLLRGPGDGVSDSIPASIGQSQQPARLADGEFVVPARIVSELGNGSTEAGARKLYAMMDRVQRARGKTTGKDRVAANTSADKYLPA